MVVDHIVGEENVQHRCWLAILALCCSLGDVMRGKHDQAKIDQTNEDPVLITVTRPDQLNVKLPDAFIHQNHLVLHNPSAVANLYQ